MYEERRDVQGGTETTRRREDDHGRVLGQALALPLPLIQTDETLRGRTQKGQVAPREKGDDDGTTPLSAGLMATTQGGETGLLTTPRPTPPQARGWRGWRRRH